MADLGVLELAFKTKLDQLDKDLAGARKKAGQAADEMGEEMDRRLGTKMSKVGVTMTKTVTPAALAMGGAFGVAFRSFDAGSDTLIAKTGASGAALESLEGSMKKVAGATTSGFGQVGAVLGDLNTALGLTGKPLEELGGQIVKLGELGESFDTTSFTRFLGDWSISSDDAGAALDRLYKIGQVTGIGVGNLMDLTVQFGAPMRALGFSVDDSTALIAKFAKEGVNTEAVLAGMKVGLGKMAKAGEEPAATFQRLVGEIKGATTEGDAFGIAAEAFGSRAGPDLAMAIREGRFSVDELSAAVADSAGSINTTHDATLDWSDKLEMLKHKVTGVIGPVGEYGMGIAGIAAGAGPMVAGVGAMIGPLGGFAAAAWAAAAPLLPWILAITAVIAIGVLLVKNWDTIKAAAGAAWDWIWEKVGGAVEAVKGFLTGLIEKVTGFVSEWGILLLGPIGALWKFRDQIGEGIGAVVDFFVALPGRIIDAISGLAGRLWDTAWDAMVRMSIAFNEKRDELLGWFGELPGKIFSALGDLGSLLWDAGKSIVTGLWNGIKSMGGWLWDQISGFISRNVPGPIKKILGIGSPSKVAHHLMLDVGAGMVGGLNASERMVARAASTLAGSVEPDLLQLAVAGHDQSMSVLSGLGSFGRDQGGAGGIDYDRLAAAIAKSTATRGMVNNFAQGTDPMHVAREIAWRAGA